MEYVRLFLPSVCENTIGNEMHKFIKYCCMHVKSIQSRESAQHTHTQGIDDFSETV